jgi:hypothetical protein
MGIFMKKKKLTLAITAVLSASAVSTAVAGDLTVGSASEAANPAAATITSDNTNSVTNSPVDTSQAISGGAVNSSVNASAIGASSYVSNNLTTAPESDVATGDIPVENLQVIAGTIEATNTGGILNGTSDVAPHIITGPTGSEMVAGGVGNSINARAIGASASLSIDQTIVDLTLGATGGSGITGALGQGAIDPSRSGTQVTATNGAAGATAFGTVDNYAQIGSATDADKAAGISGGLNNSLNIGAVGASASAGSSVSVLLESYGGDTGSYLGTNTVNVAKIDSTNHAAITDHGHIYGGNIAGAIGGSMNINAVGASASMSSSVTGLSLDPDVANGATAPTAPAQAYGAAGSSPYYYDNDAGATGNAINGSGSGSFTITSGSGTVGLGATGGAPDTITANSGGLVIQYGGATIYLNQGDIIAVDDLDAIVGVSDGTTIDHTTNAGTIGFDDGLAINGYSYFDKSGSLPSGFTGTEYFGGTAITATNIGPVTNTGIIGAPGATGPGPTISGSVNSGLNIGAVGAAGAVSSAHISNAMTDAGADAHTLNAADTLEVSSLSVTNASTGTVTNNGTITGGNISAGKGNSMGISAAGAAANVSASMSAVASGASGLDSSNVLYVGSATATNAAVVDNTGLIDGTDGGNISDGMQNSVNIAGIGARAQVSANNTMVNMGDGDGAIKMDSVNIISISQLKADNSGGITNTGDISGGNITDGYANNVGISAIGASAAASASADMYANGHMENKDQTLGNTLVMNRIEATNTGNVDNTGATVADGATIDLGNITGGTGNSVGINAVGASANASASASMYDGHDDQSPVNAINIVAASGSDTGVLADNSGAITNTGTIGSGNITGGTGNSIGISAVGVSASANATLTTAVETFYGDDPLENTLTIATASGIDTAGVGAGNFGTINNTGTVTSGNIDGGVRNSVNVSAVGAAASANASVTQSTGDAYVNNTVTVPVVIAYNAGDVTNTGVISNGSSGGTITAGVGNNIGISAVGASASASASTTDVGTAESPRTVVNTVTVPTVTASNTGTVTNTGTMDVAAIEADTGGSDTDYGVGNSIGISAVGASANASATATFDGSNVGTGSGTTNTVTVTKLTATNGTSGSSDGAVSNTGTITTASIDEGYGNNIGISAVGSSAAASSAYTNNASAAASYPANMVAVNVSGSELTSTNYGAVTNTGSITDGSITGGIGNGIGVSAIGASAVASSSYTLYNDVSDMATISANGVNVASLSAANYGAVTNTANITSGSITGGIGNSISASAVGASAGVSSSVTIAAATPVVGGGG